MTNKELYFELRGVIADVEQGDGFDDVCLETIKRVADVLAQREWQGLTDEEIEKAFMANACCDDLVVFEHVTRAIEAKLKEKNT